MGVHKAKWTKAQSRFNARMPDFWFLAYKFLVVERTPVINGIRET